MSTAVLAKYISVAQVNYRTNATYLTNILSRSGLVLIRIWIFAQLYGATYAISGTPEIGGLTLGMVVWSLMLTQSFQTAAKPPLSRQIDEEVKSGTLAYSINRPYSYMLFHFSGLIGRTIPNLLTSILIGIVAVLILVGPITLTPTGVVMGLLLLILGYILDFFMSFIIGLGAFWIEDTTAFTWIYQKSQTVFGGVLLPLTLFPDSVREVAELLPFSQLYYSAARLVVHFQWDLFWKFMSIQLGWIAIFSVVAIVLFKKGIKNVSINGG